MLEQLAQQLSAMEKKAANQQQLQQQQCKKSGAVLVNNKGDASIGEHSRSSTVHSEVGATTDADGNTSLEERPRATSKMGLLLLPLPLSNNSALSNSGENLPLFVSFMWESVDGSDFGARDTPPFPYRRPYNSS